MANLYQGVAFSPQTTLSENIGAADTIIKVSDSSVFPDPPNYATIGTDELGETIEYAAKAEGLLSGCTRGVEGAAKAWQKGDVIARNFTAKDHNDMISAVTTAQQIANNASSAATAAQQTADSAVTAVGAAQSSADTAQEAADNAKSTANAAKTIAEAALPKSGGTMAGTIFGDTYALAGKHGYNTAFMQIVNGYPYIGFAKDYSVDPSQAYRFAGVSSPSYTMDAANKLYVDSSIIRPNLLDNWYFVNPVNQRGQTSYGMGTYGIDRWLNIGAGTVTVNSNGINIASAGDGHVYFNQYIGENIPSNIKLTFSILLSDGTLHYNSGTAATGVYITDISTGWCSVAIENGKLRAQFDVLGNNTFVATKLEIGNTQTLARKEGDTWTLNEIPDYTTELLKCQRYYRRSNSTCFYGFMNSTKDGSILIPGFIMRVLPSLTFISYGAVYNSNNPYTNNITLTPLRQDSSGLLVRIQPEGVIGIGAIVITHLVVELSSEL